jgi:D-glutamate cyclase
MTTDEKLAAILAAIQIDPGNRGLARDPHDNLFTATKGDFEAACRSIVDHHDPIVAITTGFFIPSATPPAFETDGPLGVVFLQRALFACDILTLPYSEGAVDRTMDAARKMCDLPGVDVGPEGWSHTVVIERSGPGAGGRHYTMRGSDITDHFDEWLTLQFKPTKRHSTQPRRSHTIGIGDGGNEIGMGKIPHEIVAKNIPNGDLIHCRVPTDHLIVAGVSNWGAYALAAGVYVLRGMKPPDDLFDPDREREILEVMVREGPLVDGVTGKQTATVDGLTWEEYVKPLIRIREILES